MNINNSGAVLTLISSFRIIHAYIQIREDSLSGTVLDITPR